MNAPAVSVLIPVYNAASTLGQAIRSILTQNFTDFELLIIDDGSTDGSPAVIKDYAEQDPRIRTVFHAQNQGLAATLNEGLRLAQGAFVARMDNDDEALRERLGVQTEFLHAHPDIAVVGSWVYHMGNSVGGENSETVGLKQPRDHLVTLPTDHEAIEQALKQYNCLYHPSVMFRREAILAAGGYRAEFKNAEDYDLWLRISQQAQLANIAQPLLRYRFSLSGMTLGRKWQQLYYVYLAQVVNQSPDLPFTEAQVRAQAQLDATDKQHFLTQVAIGTVDELTLLQQWGDALKLIRKFRLEIGGAQSWQLLKTLVHRYRDLVLLPCQ